MCLSLKEIAMGLVRLSRGRRVIVLSPPLSSVVAVAAAARRCRLLPPPLLLDLELALVVAAVVQALEVVVGPRLARGRVLAVVLDALFFCCLSKGSRERVVRRPSPSIDDDDAPPPAVFPVTCSRAHGQETPSLTLRKSMKKW